MPKNKQNGKSSSQSSCKRGHEYTKENTRIDKDGKKHCRKCDDITRTRTAREMLAGVENGNGQLVLNFPARITDTALEIKPGLPMEQWAEIGPKLGKVDKWASFAVGDWLIYGHNTYGEEYAQFVHSLGISEDKAQILEYVAMKVPPEIRRKELQLSWYHHRLVAKLEHDEQSYWLARALSHEWSVREMKEAMNGPEEPEQENEDTHEAGENGAEDRERSCEGCGRAPAPAKACPLCLSVIAAALPIGHENALVLLKDKPTKAQRELMQWAFEQVKEPDFEGWPDEEKTRWNSHYARLQRAATH